MAEFQKWVRVELEREIVSDVIYYIEQSRNRAMKGDERG